MHPYCEYHNRHHTCCETDRLAYTPKPMSDFEEAARKVMGQWIDGLITSREYALKMYEISILHPEGN